ncbi:YjgP/YjgQ family permease [bacterium]|nr:MAG: YjgP/YjgQ family permease [bacterium]
MRWPFSRWPLGRLDRYILRELIPLFCVALVIVLTMFQVNLYIYLGKTFDLSRVPAKAIFKLILYESPSFLNWTLPIAVALATSLAMSRLARESELTAMRAAGTRILRVMWPVAMFGAAVGMMNLYSVDQIVPRAAAAGQQLRIQVGILGSAARFQANLPLRLKQYNVSLGEVTRNDDDSLTIRNAVLIERPQPNTVSILAAPEAEYRNGVWSFNGAHIWTTEMGTDTLLEAKTQDRVLINERIVVEDLFNPSQAKDLSIADLREKIADGRRTGQDVRALEIEYQVKFSLPAVCLIFALVCPIFSIALARQGGYIGVVVSLIAMMIYYNVWVASTQILAKIPSVAPWQAAWIPNLIIGALGLYGLRRLE